MIFLNNKIPSPLVALIFATMMWGVSEISGITIFNEPLAAAYLLGLLFVAILFCGAGVWSFKSAQTTVNPLAPQSASSLVTNGIYRYSRNPMYVGFVLILIAWSLYLNILLSLLLVVAYGLYIQYFQIKPEEKALLKLFGDEFEQYQQQVRRWL